MPTQTSVDSVFGLVVALLCGGLIGLERQLRGHPAGLHTNALVALGSAAFVMAGAVVGDTAGSVRVVGQVVTGVGFLCGGVILHQGATVRGINTAATVWCAAAVGVFAGIGRLPTAGLVSVMVVLTNVTLHYVEHQMLRFGQDSGAS